MKCEVTFEGGQKWIVLCINKNLYWFWISNMFLWWITFAIVQAIKGKTYWWVNFSWRLLKVTVQYNSLKYSLKWPHLHTNIFPWTSKTFKCCAKISTFLSGPPTGYNQARKLYLSWNNGPLGIKSLSNEPMQNKESHQVIWQWTWTENGKDDAHQTYIFKVKIPVALIFEYVDSELSMFVKIFKF
jgi:hypothetical protein